MNFSKSNLKFNGEYNWKAPKGDNPNITGSPDSDLLNRKEGYEVLYFIQQFMKKKKLRSTDHGEKAETLIKQYLPGHIRNRKDVESWLDENWDKSNEELELIKEGYKPLIEYFDEATFKKLDTILKIRNISRRELFTQLIDEEYDFVIEA